VVLRTNMIEFQDAIVLASAVLTSTGRGVIDQILDPAQVVLFALGGGT
jgi:hypothetical protein